MDVETYTRSVTIRDAVIELVDSHPGLGRMDLIRDLMDMGITEEEAQEGISTLMFLGIIQRVHNGRRFTFWPGVRG